MNLTEVQQWMMTNAAAREAKLKNLRSEDESVVVVERGQGQRLGDPSFVIKAVGPGVTQLVYEFSDTEATFSYEICVLPTEPVPFTITTEQP